MGVRVGVANFFWLIYKIFLATSFLKFAYIIYLVAYQLDCKCLHKYMYASDAASLCLDIA